MKFRNLEVSQFNSLEAKPTVFPEVSRTPRHLLFNFPLKFLSPPSAPHFYFRVSHGNSLIMFLGSCIPPRCPDAESAFLGAPGGVCLLTVLTAQWSSQGPPHLQGAIPGFYPPSFGSRPAIGCSQQTGLTRVWKDWPGIHLATEYRPPGGVWIPDYCHTQILI